MKIKNTTADLQKKIAEAIAATNVQDGDAHAEHIHDMIEELQSRVDSMYGQDRPQENIDWDFVIDNGFAVALSHASQEQADKVAADRKGLWRRLDDYDPDGGGGAFIFRNTRWEYCSIVRVPHVIQPHFGTYDGNMPDDLDEMNCSMVTIYRRSGIPRFIPRSQLNEYDWQHHGEDADIVAFVAHPYLY